MHKSLLTALLACCAANAHAVIVVYNIDINVAQEVPVPNVSGLSPLPSGTGTITLDTTTNTVSWVINYSGLSGNIVSPGAHIHGPAAPGATAGVFVFLAGGTGAPLPQPPSGTLTGSRVITPAQTTTILNGLAYVNIHTQRNGAGEIRGQIVDRCQGDLVGDANCDGVVNFDDIDCFIAALVSPANWAACGAGPGCLYECVNDVNGDGNVNFDDIDPFIDCLISGSC